MDSAFYAALATELLDVNAYVVPLVGEEHVRRNDPPPRMIFFPTPGADQISAPEGPGGNPKPLFTRLEAHTVVIHGQSRDICRGMADQFMIALHQVCKKATSGTSRAGRYVFSKAGFTRSSLIATNGFEYVMTFAVAVPVVKRRWAALPDPDAPPSPENPAEAPDASTYTGEQANTYATAPSDEVEIDADVGQQDDAPDNVAIVINDQDPEPDPEPDP